MLSQLGESAPQIADLSTTVMIALEAAHNLDMGILLESWLLHCTLLVGCCRCSLKTFEFQLKT